MEREETERHGKKISQRKRGTIFLVNLSNVVVFGGRHSVRGQDVQR